MVSLNQCCLTAESDADAGFQLLMACQDYLQLGSRSAKQIVRIEGAQVFYSPENVQIESSAWVTAAKVASWILTAGILPLLAGLVILIGQNNYTVEMDREHFQQYTQRIITETDPSWATYNRARANGGNACDQILENLYLGDGLSFLDCTDLEIAQHDNFGRRIGMRNSGNPLGFKNVITLCPVQAVSEHVEGVQEQAVSGMLTRTGVNWVYVGRGIQDGSRSDDDIVLNLKWFGLVYDCSLESELSNFDPIGKTPSDVEKNLVAKTLAMQGIRPDAFFQRAFEVMDHAVFNQEKTLVHCAQGVSRSASLVIAWIMNRFNRTAEEATAFVRSKRPCIDPRFAVQLKSYEAALRADRPQQATA